MLACIPTNGNAGLGDTVCDHFGSAPYFTLYNSDDDNLEIIENRNAHHSHGTCHPLNHLTRYRLNGVICAGMGRRAIEALSVEGIKVYRAPSRYVGEVVAKLKTGELTEMDARTACRGHGQKGAPVLGPSEGRGAGYGQGCGQRHGGGMGGNGSRQR
jgi:predicted Fe-Mo cluster-binding NifX family protein